MESIKARDATLEFKKPTHFQVDGEYLGKVRKVRAKVMEAVLKVIVNDNKFIL